MDDDAATRELLSTLFDQAHATVETVDSAAAAIAAVQARTPEVLIADIGAAGRGRLLTDPADPCAAVAGLRHSCDRPVSLHACRGPRSRTRCRLRSVRRQARLPQTLLLAVDDLLRHTRPGVSARRQG